MGTLASIPSVKSSPVTQAANNTANYSGRTKDNIVPADGGALLGLILDHASLVKSNIVTQTIENFRFDHERSDFEGYTGKKAAIFAGYQPWFLDETQKWNPYPSSWCSTVRKQCGAIKDGQGTEKSIPLIKWEPWGFPRDNGQYLLDAIINAQPGDPIYEYIFNWAVAQRDRKETIILAPLPDMNGDKNAWRGAANGADVDHVKLIEKDADGNYVLRKDPSTKEGNGIDDGPERCIAAWIKIWNIFDQANALDNVLFALNLHASNLPVDPDNKSRPIFGWNTIGAYYPGAKYVDMVIFTGYMQYIDDVFGGQKGIFSDAIDFMNKSKIRKPVMLEAGINPVANRPQFLQSLLQFAQANNIKGVIISNVDKNNLFSPAAAYKADNISDRYFGAYQAYRKYAAENACFLGEATAPTLGQIPKTCDNVYSLEENVRTIVEKAETNETIAKAKKKAFNLRARIDGMNKFAEKCLAKEKYQLIVKSADQYEDLLGQYEVLGALRLGMSDKKFIKEKTKLLATAVKALMSIPEDQKVYILALDKLKYMVYGWSNETTESEKRAIIFDDENFKVFNKAFDTTKEMIYYKNNRPKYSYSVKSSTYHLSERIISLASNDAYCDLAGVKLSKDARYGLLSSAYLMEAVVTLDYYYAFKDSGDMPDIREEAMFAEIRECLKKAREFSEKKQATLQGGVKAVSSKVYGPYVERYIDKKAYLDRTDFHLNREIDLINAQLMAQSGDKKAIEEAKKIYDEFIQNKDVGADKRFRAKRLYARILQRQGDKESLSRALSIWDELTGLCERTLAMKGGTGAAAELKKKIYGQMTP